MRVEVSTFSLHHLLPGKVRAEGGTQGPTTHPAVAYHAAALRTVLGGEARSGGEPAGSRTRVDGAAPCGSTSAHHIETVHADLRVPVAARRRPCAAHRRRLGPPRARPGTTVRPTTEGRRAVQRHGRIRASLEGKRKTSPTRPLNRCSGRTQVGAPQSIYDVCVDKGRGWRPGRVRGFLRAYVAKHASVPKRRAFRYTGPPVAPVAAMLLRIHSQLPPVYPPDDWVPPPEPGLEGSAGTRLVEEQPWRPVCPHASESMIHSSVRNTASRSFICLDDVRYFASHLVGCAQAGDSDGSMFLTPKTAAELDEELHALKLCSLVDMQHELSDPDSA